MRGRPPRPARIYAIADAEALGSTPLPGAVAAMADAGVRWIQVRAKRLSGRDLFAAIEGCCRELEGSETALWVDDRADLAALFPVAGVHVGQTDLPPAAARRAGGGGLWVGPATHGAAPGAPPGGARRVVGDALWLGLSTHGEAQLKAADADPEVDVVAVGPVFP